MARDRRRTDDVGAPGQGGLEGVLAHLQEPRAGSDLVGPAEQREHEAEAPELRLVVQTEPHPLEAGREPGLDVAGVGGLVGVLAGAPAVVAELEDLREQGVLVREVPVDRARRKPGGLADQRDRRAVVAALGRDLAAPPRGCAPGTRRPACGVARSSAALARPLPVRLGPGGPRRSTRPEGRRRVVRRSGAVPSARQHPRQREGRGPDRRREPTGLELVGRDRHRDPGDRLAAHQHGCGDAADAERGLLVVVADARGAGWWPARSAARPGR